jgi:hypothetical protein
MGIINKTIVISLDAFVGERALEQHHTHTATLFAVQNSVAL